MYIKSIQYDYEVRDYACYLNDELVSFARSYHEAEITLDQLISELMSSQSAIHTCPGTGLADCGKPLDAPGYCPRCAEVLDRVFVETLADPPAGPDSDPVPPWPNLFDQYRAAYGWACVELSERQTVEIAA